jgi:hypothetical protein
MKTKKIFFAVSHGWRPRWRDFIIAAKVYGLRGRIATPPVGDPEKSSRLESLTF